jgi:quinol-cytochrome oxidoreductase complex cytochrome b subunit
VKELSRKAYLFHFRPRAVNPAAMRFTFTWGLGGTAATLVLLQMATGALLKFDYVPSPDKAYRTVLALQHTVVFGRFIRSMHHWGASALILIVFLHLLRVFFTGAFTDKRRINWWVGLGLLIAVIGANFTGYLLPWDQLSYWAVTICTAMLAYLPGIGGWLQETIIGGTTLGPATLTNFFALHTAIIPALLIVLLPFHFWRIRKAGGLAAGGRGHTARIEVIPHLIVRELAVACAVTAVVMLMAALWDAPLGPEANPGLSPNPTKAPWYFAGLQELLLHLHPMMAVAVIPLSVLAALILLPFLPHPTDTAGIWFGTKSGRRYAAAAAIAALMLTPIWVVGHASGLTFLAWLAPLSGLTIVAGIYWIVRGRLHAPPHLAIQSGITFLLTVFIVLTLTGIFFRGASMALQWPWQ